MFFETKKMLCLICVYKIVIQYKIVLPHIEM